MPELPEVETIVRELSRKISGKTLCRFLVFDKKRIKEPKLSLPQKIKSVSRRGKYIVFIASDNLRCLIHLRMTGWFIFEKDAKDSPEFLKHERAAFNFCDGSKLRFIDVRRFGTIIWQKGDRPLPRLGLEPLSRSFNAKVLSGMLHNGNKAIKSVLLDQQLIAGLGNIYADESLWAAKIHPLRKSGSLKKSEITRLTLSIKKILREAIKKGGFTLRDYRRPDGNSGFYQNSRKVYKREGKPCFRCGAKIRRIKIGSRSVHFCPVCQRPA
jgi:formamidopyrimidine-DNA glycosylase